LFKLLQSLSAKARPARLQPSRSLDMLSNVTSSSKTLGIPTSTQLADSNGYLKVFPTPNCRSLSPPAYKKEFMVEKKAFSIGKYF